MAIYRIRDWDKHFEKAQTRKVDNASWVPVPVKHDGLGFRSLMRMDGGLAIYGAWILILQVAAKCPERGVLADERGPLTAEKLEIKTGCAAKHFDTALKVLSSNDIGWLLVDGYQTTGSALPLQTNKEDKTEQEKQDKEGAPLRGCPPPLRIWIDWWNGLRADGLVPCGASSDHPSEAILKGWARVEKSAQLRAMLSDPAKLAEQIRKAPFCREGWFRLEKLLGGKNRDGTWILEKLLEGGYEDSRGETRKCRMPTSEEMKGYSP